MRSFVLGLLVLLPYIYAAAAARLVVHEKRHVMPSQWAKRSRAATTGVLPMRIALTQRNLDQGEKWLMDVSHPASPRYGQHWSHQQIVDSFSPSDETISAVQDWLAGAGIARDRVSLSRSRGWLAFNATIAEAETLLRTEYYVYEQDAGQFQVACNSYAVPDSVQNHIDFVMPALHPLRLRNGLQPQKSALPRSATALSDRNLVPHVPLLQRQSSGNSSSSSSLALCNETITLDCLRALYQIPISSSAAPDNSFGIIEFPQNSYLQSDLDLFFSEYLPDLVGKPPILDSVNGGLPDPQGMVPSDVRSEADLDLQVAMGLVYPLNVTLFQLDQGSLNHFLDAVDSSYCTYEGGDDPSSDGSVTSLAECGLYAPPNVFSVSYSYSEAQYSPFYEQRQCNEYMKLGLRGVSAIMSSADNGVGGQMGCGAGGILNVFATTFPNNCPWVTSVGETQIRSNGTVNDTEIARLPLSVHAYPNSGSGGGFSDVFPLPDYQASAVNAWFDNYPPPYSSAQFNNSRKARAYPDMSANGANYRIAVSGVFELIGGTSASAPCVGSIITLINNARLNAGKGPVGFINPVLYSHPEILNDIVEGSNPGCLTNGFSCAPGWDPVTGLGTPNFPKMLDLFMSLP